MDLRSPIDRAGTSPRLMPLGQMHRALKDCENSKPEIWRKFNRWVRMNRRPLLKDKIRLALGEICGIHNRAKHDERFQKRTLQKCLTYVGSFSRSYYQVDNMDRAGRARRPIDRAGSLLAHPGDPQSVDAASLLPAVETHDEWIRCRPGCAGWVSSKPTMDPY